METIAKRQLPGGGEVILLREAKLTTVRWVVMIALGGEDLTWNWHDSEAAARRQFETYGNPHDGKTYGQQQ